MGFCMFFSCFFIGENEWIGHVSIWGVLNCIYSFCSRNSENDLSLNYHLHRPIQITPVAPLKLWVYSNSYWEKNAGSLNSYPSIPFPLRQLVKHELSPVEEMKLVLLRDQYSTKTASSNDSVDEEASQRSNKPNRNTKPGQANKVNQSFSGPLIVKIPKDSTSHLSYSSLNIR